MTTRSTKLWAAVQTGRPSGIVFTAPSDVVVLLKTIYFFAYGGTTTNVTIAVSQPAPNLNVQLFSAELQSGVPERWEGWLVMQPGDQVVFIWDANSVYSWGSGTLLPPAPA